MNREDKVIYARMTSNNTTNNTLCAMCTTWKCSERDEIIKIFHQAPYEAMVPIGMHKSIYGLFVKYDNDETYATKTTNTIKYLIDYLTITGTCILNIPEIITVDMNNNTIVTKYMLNLDHNDMRCSIKAWKFIDEICRRKAGEPLFSPLSQYDIYMMESVPMFRWDLNTILGAGVNHTYDHTKVMGNIDDRIKIGAYWGIDIMVRLYENSRPIMPRVPANVCICSLVSTMMLFPELAKSMDYRIFECPALSASTRT